MNEDGGAETVTEWSRTQNRDNTAAQRVKGPSKLQEATDGPIDTNNWMI